MTGTGPIENGRVSSRSTVYSNGVQSKRVVKSLAVRAINCELAKTGAGCLTNFCSAVAACAFADLSALLDANGNELLILDTTAAAVNELTLSNAATGTNPVFTASGGDTNVGINFKPKGTGTFNFLATASGPTDIRLYEDADNGVNYISIIAPATITSNSVLTLPEATDTLIGKATTDNLTNKTLMTLSADKTITATVGAVTINKPIGAAIIAASAASVVVTNSLVTVNSVITAQLRSVDGTLLYIKSVAPGAGSFTITGNAAATGNTAVSFVVWN